MTQSRVCWVILFSHLGDIGFGVELAVVVFSSSLFKSHRVVVVPVDFGATDVVLGL